MPTKVHLVKAMVFPVVMYGCESWTVKKAECRGIDAFELWCWRRLLRVPWTARRSNQSILNGISPGCSLEGLMLKVKLQYLGHLMQKANSLKKTLMLGRLEGRRRRGDRGWDGWTASSTQWKWFCANSRRWWRTGKPGVPQSMGSQRVGHNWATLCDPMNRSTPGLPVHHQLPEFTETHVHQVSDAIQPSHPLSSPSPPAPNPSQHQGLFQWVVSSHQMV